MEYKVFGCKTNRYFAEKWLVHPHLRGRDGYFIASCVVTDRAKAKWVRHAKKKLSLLTHDEKLFLSGCGNIRDGVVDPRFFEVYPELALYREQIEILPEDPDDFSMSPEEKKEMMRTKIRSLARLRWKEIFTRKFIVVQTGCDNFCTFCLTVQARGRHKWRPADEIIAEIDAFVMSGGKEVVFTGINLWAWWSLSSNDYRDSKLIDLIRRVLSDTQLERLRISSLGVEFLTDELIDMFKNRRINAYVHLSIQSGSSTMLHAMNRHYDGVRVRAVLEKLRCLEREDGVMLNIGADLIVWFPGEDEDDFNHTERIVRDFQITQLHAFAFSPHVDHYSVPAGKFDHQVPRHIVETRTRKILTAWEEVFWRFASDNIGRELRVLVEKTHVGGFSGWSLNYLFCNETNFLPFPQQKIERGAVVCGIYQQVIKKSSQED
jgi:MiaB/RimO family radical SAM methylthiotransferase